MPQVTLQEMSYFVQILATLNDLIQSMFRSCTKENHASSKVHFIEDFDKEMNSFET